MTHSKTEGSKAQGQFTGWHMTAVLIAFFGVIMAVNFTMAGFATSGFSGTVVDNSYVASQKFNGWLAAAEAQEKLGWRLKTERLADDHIAVSISTGDAPLGAFSAKAVAERPLGAKESVELDFVQASESSLRSRQPLPHGRWQIYLTVNSAGQKAYLESSLP